MNGMGNEPSYKGTGGIGISVKIRNRISTLLLILLCLCLGIQASTEIREDSQWIDRLNKALSWKCMDLWCPSFNYADYGWYQDNLAEQIRGAIWRGIPLYIFLQEQETCMAYTQSEPVDDASIILQQTRDEEDALQRSVQAENEEALRDQQNPEVEQPLQEQEQDQKPDQYSDNRSVLDRVCSGKRKSSNVSAAAIDRSPVYQKGVLYRGCHDQHRYG